jgi:SAM-dependent methyltransferase
MNLPPGSVVLDGGAGSGAISCFLAAEYGWRILALDSGADAIQKRANEQGLGDRVTALKGDLTRLDLARDSVDGVFCQGTFEMIQEARPLALREMARVTRAGGPIGIGEPMLNRDLTEPEALWLYGEEDVCEFRKCFRTVPWNLDLARETGLEIGAAFLHPESQRLWDEFYRPLLDENGVLTRPDRAAEVDIWRKEAGRYHALGVLIARNPR